MNKVIYPAAVIMAYLIFYALQGAETSDGTPLGPLTFACLLWVGILAGMTMGVFETLPVREKPKHSIDPS